jgi:hypothetical protein
MPGMRKISARASPAQRRPQWRTASSASTRRNARRVKGATGLDSLTHSPWQSPYTPLVDPYTTELGTARLDKAASNASVRGSRIPSPGGGARWSTRVASPASRRRLAGSSRLPGNGTTPSPRKTDWRSGVDVKASTRARRTKDLATRWPTSPQPTIKTRSRRKRAGKAPRGVWFEGTIQELAARLPGDQNPKDTER